MDEAVPHGTPGFTDCRLFRGETTSNDHARRVATLPGYDCVGAKFAAFDEPIMNTTKATLTDFRAWHVLRAVNANRQLLEILLQFLENHFVTEYGKSYKWLNNKLRV